MNTRETIWKLITRCGGYYDIKMVLALTEALEVREGLFTMNTVREQILLEDAIDAAHSRGRI